MNKILNTESKLMNKILNTESNSGQRSKLVLQDRQGDARLTVCSTSVFQKIMRRHTVSQNIAENYSERRLHTQADKIGYTYHYKLILIHC